MHGHGVPRSFLESVARARTSGVEVEFDRHDGGCTVTFAGHRALRPMPRRMLDFQKRLEWLDEQGMRRQIVAPWLDVQGQQLDTARGTAWVRELNDFMAEAVADSGGRLVGHATLYMGDPGAAARELERCHGDLGMHGCMIPAHPPGADIADRGYDVLWGAAESMGVPVVLHPVTDGPATQAPSMADFAGLYARLIDTTTAATRLILAGVLDRFPALRLVLVHGGGLLPYQTGRLDREQEGRPNRWGMNVPLSEYVRRCYFDTVLMSGPAIRLLLDLVGRDHVVIGSDYPFSVGAPPLTESVNQATGDLETRAAVVHANAVRLFGGGAAGTW